MNLFALALIEIIPGGISTFSFQIFKMRTQRSRAFRSTARVGAKILSTLRTWRGASDSPPLGRARVFANVDDYKVFVHWLLFYTLCCRNT